MPLAGPVSFRKSVICRTLAGDGDAEGVAAGTRRLRGGVTIDGNTARRPSGPELKHQRKMRDGNLQFAELAASLSEENSGRASKTSSAYFTFPKGAETWTP